jgi:PAS domain S-box-containing protein
MVRGQIHTRTVNPAHARISGVPADRCQELSRYRDLTHPDDRSRQDALHQRLVAGEIDEYTVEKRYVRDDKSVCWAMLTVRCFHDASTNEDQEISTLVDISERKKSETELENLHKQLLETSRQAGMAEVATSVLHNVGNVLNSVNVSATLVAEGIERFGPARLEKLCALLREHEGDLGRFLADDAKGRQVPRYLEALAAQSRTDREHLSGEVAQLRKNIEHIKEIVAMQQSYAKVSGVAETVSLADLIEDALRMNAGALVRHDVNVVRDFSATPLLTVEKHKVLQILINLIRNAKYACDDTGRSDKTLTVRITADAQYARVAVIDNGVGIPAENLTRIFAHGFTTRKHGHGFGLHSGALTAREMGGTLTAHSDGPGRGAMFVLELPHQAAAAEVAVA